MTDYESMSDFEINSDVSSFTDLSVTKYGNHKSPYVWNEDEDKEFDPCNNPSDAWPIIVENDISIIAPHNIKPLRDAMIVFLMMKEAEQ